MKFTVPEYYEKFSCKGGSCRHSCCHGWGITLTMEEYYRLIGIDCTSSLRKRLDIAFYPVDVPSPERFAKVNLRYDGDCPLHAEDGLCELHREKGEGVIPSVCRMYPRCVRHDSCVCTSSCERVIELLDGLDSPLGFVVRELDIAPVYGSGNENEAFPFERWKTLLCDTAIPLRARLSAVAGFEIAEKPCCDEEYSVLTILAEASDAVDEYVIPAAAVIHGGTDKYSDAVSGFERAFPEWELLFTNILLNHLFFTKYDNVCDSAGRAVALCQLYAMMRVTAAGTFFVGGGKNDVIDCLAGMFRYAEHSNYYEKAPSLMSKCGISCGKLLAF